ncbi:ribosomal protein S18 acetylase RimI-like enzyme [Paenibacillus taihuensis]|uniref:Ribosomal protein S18 acetylase RimI-like enzyme n=1 Tax=Paenibacillus taihuensis TaxID=1156355 RepID=A0A3D9QUX8_9BACL|nr:GNAT family N-acetyltransferase [Paenibacillus taihuensis]REE67956.1 ribosomal protein S18 acetylase RimI-like enzyme [Paenibacillus taihuensis]
MSWNIEINCSIEPYEVPALRELVGWEGRHADYPALFERCNFWAGVRDAASNELIAFGYVAGTGLQHGYMEDVIVHPKFQRRGVGQALVRELLLEAERFGLEIVTVTFAPEHTSFYTESGFQPCQGGLWRKV